MATPHFTQLSNVGSPGGPGTHPDEVMYLNLFEITFVLPTILQAQGRNALLMLENATSVPIKTTEDFDIGAEMQHFKYSTRQYLKTPEKTSGDFDIKFNVNVNEQGSMEVWNTLKAWYDLVWNSQNGWLHYKSDIIGTVIVNQHDKKGVIIRRVTYQNAQLHKLSGYDLDWTSASIWTDCSAGFVYDYFIDEYIDNNVTITPPIVSGYTN
jgi:hypothetical protein